MLFTNYQFYIDEFVKLGREAMQDPSSPYIAFIEPSYVVTRRVGQHLKIGIRAMELLRSSGVEHLHSRKLRSFNEVAFQ